MLARMASRRAAAHSARLVTRTAQRAASADTLEGEGGRMSNTGRTVTVFGGYGFLGSLVVHALAGSGTTVVAPYRGDELEARHMKHMGDLGKVHLLPFHPGDLDSIREAVRHSDCVINLIGSSVESHKPMLKNQWTFDRVHRSVTRNLASVSKTMGVERFVQMSTLLADPESPSRWAASKAMAELEAQDYFPDATIVRSATMFGAGDQLLCPVASAHRADGRVCIVNGGEKRLRPVFVDDVAAIVAACATDDNATSQLVELYGPDEYTYREVVEYMYAVTRMEPNVWSLTPEIASLATTLMAFKSPFADWDEVTRQTLDELPSGDPNALTFDSFKYKPVHMEDVAFKFLVAFRPGSHFLYEDDLA